MRVLGLGNLFLLLLQTKKSKILRKCKWDNTLNIKTHYPHAHTHTPSGLGNLPAAVNRPDRR